MKTLAEILNMDNTTENVKNYVFAMTRTELEGSEKQITWAQSIRSGDVNSFITELSEAITRIQFLVAEKDESFLEKYFTKKIQPMINKLEFYNNTKSAGEIINNRFD